MNDPLEIPDELQHLIEKRSSDNGRRKTDQSKQENGNSYSDNQPAVERRKKERRKD